MSRTLFALSLIAFSLSFLLGSPTALMVVCLISLVHSFVLMTDLLGAESSEKANWTPLTAEGCSLKSALDTQRCQLSLRSAQLEGFVRQKAEAERLAQETVRQDGQDGDRLGRLLYERVAHTMRRRFRASIAGLVVASSKGPEIFIDGASTERLKSALLHLFDIYLRNPCAPTGLLDESIVTREIGDFSQVGMNKLVVHRVGMLDGSFVLVVLAYSERVQPSEFDRRAIREFVGKFGEGLLSQAKLEEFQRKVLDLESAASKKNELLSHMSHDIRSPLNNVRTTLELLKIEATQNESTLLIDSAILNCDALSEIVDELMIFFKHSSGKLKAVPREMDVLELVRSVINAYAVSAMKKSLHLEVYSTVKDPFVFADPLQLKRVLSNLVGNALKYTESGEVLVSVDDQQKGMISICVHDTGLGMSPDEVEQLFTPFRRFHEGFAEGVGLGLAVTRALVEVNKGTIRVSSKKGEGSRFRVTFPAFSALSARGEQDQREDFTVKRRRDEKKRVLLVDDDVQLVDSLARVIESEEFEVDRAYSVSEAKGISTFSKPDAVVLDFRMPNGGARELLRHLRAAKSEPYCAVLTGDDHAVVEESLQGFSVHKLFRKPIEIPELKAWLRQSVLEMPRKQTGDSPQALAI